jgi:hypothetical protein
LVTVRGLVIVSSQSLAYPHSQTIHHHGTFYNPLSDSAKDLSAQGTVLFACGLGSGGVMWDGVEN